MTVDHYRNVVGKIPMLQGLGTPLRERLSDILVDIATERLVEAGDVLYEKDAEDENTGSILLDGILEVTRDSGDKIEVTAPDLVGEMLQLNDYGRRTATVSAKTKSVMLEFSWHEFIQSLTSNVIITDNDRIAIKEALTKVAGTRLKELME